VVVADPVAEEGLALLRPHARVETVAGQPDQLAAHLPEAEALLDRKVESLDAMRAAARAG
jgi:hypothetical protein